MQTAAAAGLASHILAYPHDALRLQAVAIAQVTDEIKANAERMLALMYEHNGVGLAANQVGWNQRVLVYDVSEERDQPKMLANPVITARDDEKLPYEEGCLSVLEVREEVVRPQAVTVKAIDLSTGEEIEFESASHLEAVCLQHEIDHLDGVLFFDHLSRLKRERLLKRYDKACAERAAAAAETA